MTDVLDAAALARWRANPISFIEQVLRDPETNKPFQLFEAQRQFFAHAWRLDAAGRLLFPEQCFAAPKKSGKSATAALHLLTTTILFGGKFCESYTLANDLEQSQGRVFQAARRIVECSPLLKREAEITQTRITFPQTGAVIQAIGADYAGAAGANPVVSSFDELWAYTSERGRRLFDEMIPPPTRKIACRLTTTYAGFENESSLLLELHKRGMAQPEIAPNLHAGDGLLMAWHHEPVAPWQDEKWLSEMRRSLRPNQFLRMIENRFVTSESPFISMAAWDRCVDPGHSAAAVDKGLSVHVGIDASTKHDSTAIVAVHWDRKAQQARLVFHRVYQPSPDEPLNFEETIERTLLDLRDRFLLRKCLYDPWQLQASAQRLAKQGVRLEEYPQSPSNLTQASQNLYELINAQGITLYPDAGMRLAASRAVAVETPRGWRIGKQQQTHKIDLIVALSMAALAAVRGQSESSYETPYGPFTQDDTNAAAADAAAERFLQSRYEQHVRCTTATTVRGGGDMKTRRRTDDAYLDEDDVARDGEVVRCPIFLMDAVQRAVAGVDLSDHQPGFRRANDAARGAVRSARSRWVRSLNDAWRGPLDARRKRYEDPEEPEGTEGQYNEQDPRKIGKSALTNEPDDEDDDEPNNPRRRLRTDARSISDARAAATASYHRMCARLRDAWRTPSRDAGEPDAAEELLARHLRTEEDDDAQRKRNDAWMRYRDQLSNAWQQGRTDPTAATRIERQGEQRRHGK
jgi:phage terminase large subunit-like protein